MDYMDLVFHCLRKADKFIHSLQLSLFFMILNINDTRSKSLGLLYKQ